ADDRARQAEVDRAAAEVEAREQRKRRRVVQWAAGAGAAVLLLGIAGTTAGLIVAREQRDAADAARRAEGQRAEGEARAKEQTQKRLSQIERGVELFAGMLKGINPHNEAIGGPTLYEQLRERAERAADQLDGEAVGDPLAVARLQTILGGTLLELGNAPKAVAVLEAAAATRGSILGADHPDTLTTLSNLGEAYRAVGRVAEAVPLLERVRDESAVKLGAGHPDTLTTLNNLAAAYLSAGRAAEAVPLLERVRDALTVRLGAGDLDALLALNNLAAAYQSVGRLGEAVSLYERVRDGQTARLGAGHSDTLATLGNLAEAYREVGRVGDAVPLLERVRDARVAKLGADHPDALTAVGSLARAYAAAGRVDEAVPLLEDCLRRRRAKLGPDHPDTLTTKENLAVARTLLAAEGRYRATAAEKGPGHIDTLLARRDLAQVHMFCNRLDDAEAILCEVLDGMKDRPPDDPIASFTVRVLRKCLADRQRLYPDAWATFNTHSLLGGALLGRGKPAEAEPLLLAGYEGMKERAKTIPPVGRVRLAEAADRLVDLYEALGRPDEAKKWRAERAKYPPPAAVAPPPREAKP
ncbi:MAG: tetratricopeptide repeat protein, partial [Gemmataceae bacterium]|nr:tetratricopeptide repeat protein [Gemmataceae bacterium]